MEKTQHHKDMMRDNGLRPFWWKVVCENGHFFQIVNRITRERKVIRK